MTGRMEAAVAVAGELRVGDGSRCCCCWEGGRRCHLGLPTAGALVPSRNADAAPPPGANSPPTEE